MWKGFTERAARTGPDSNDPVLAGRTYAIPFDPVWKAALELSGGGLRGWKLVSSDDRLGVIRADVRGPLLPLEANVLVSVTLDRNASAARQSAPQPPGGPACELPKIGHFFRSLDTSLDVRPEQILEPRSPARHAA